MSVPRIGVLAGVNGAGKSSVGGALLGASGSEFLNPDAVAARLRATKPSLSTTAANSLAWRANLARLQDAIETRQNYFFETTLGGRSIVAELERALDAGIPVHMWYVGLESVDLHIARVAQRVRAGGHPIPTPKIRERFDSSRANLVRLLPRLTSLTLVDNSVDAGTRPDGRPLPRILLRMTDHEIVSVCTLTAVPDWAKPIVMAAVRVSPRR